MKPLLMKETRKYYKKITHFTNDSNAGISRIITCISYL